MRVHIVCKFNQARSIVASALVRKLYPELPVFSSGIIAHDGAPIPQFIANIAHRWGLEKFDPISTLFELGEPVRDGDLVICADTEIFEHLALLNLPGTLVDVTQFSLNVALIPSDPRQMSIEETEAELAKMAIASMSVLERHVEVSRPHRCTTIFLDNKNSERVIAFIQAWLEETQGFAIDMNWKIPDRDFWLEHKISVTEFNPRNFDLHLASNSAPVMLSSLYEIDNPVEILTSAQWSAFLDSLDSPILGVVRVASMDELHAHTIFPLIYASELILLE